MDVQALTKLEVPELMLQIVDLVPQAVDGGVCVVIDHIDLVAQAKDLVVCRSKFVMHCIELLTHSTELTSQQGIVVTQSGGLCSKVPVDSILPLSLSIGKGGVLPENAQHVVERP